MLEKIFGKKSTGVVYIVCAGVLLLSLIGAAVYFLANYPNASLYSLFVQALLTAFSLAAISAPVFIQKRFKFFIPPFIEIALCVYSVLLFLLTRFHTETIILNSFLPAVGGFILSMLFFAFLYKILTPMAEQILSIGLGLQAIIVTLIMLGINYAINKYYDYLPILKNRAIMQMIQVYALICIIIALVSINDIPQNLLDLALPNS